MERKGILSVRPKVVRVLAPTREVPPTKVVVPTRVVGGGEGTLEPGTTIKTELHNKASAMLI